MLNDEFWMEEGKEEGRLEAVMINVEFWILNYG